MNQCRLEGELRAFLDGELPTETISEIRDHLDGCSACREKLEQIESNRVWLNGRMEIVAPRSEAVPNTGQALARLQERLDQKTGWKERFLTMFNSINRRWRPALIALAAIAIIASALTLEPVKAAAQDFLSIFRVRQFAAIPIGPEQQETLNEIGTLLDQNFFLSDPVMTTQMEEINVETLEQAEEIVGFHVRPITSVPSDFEPDTIHASTQGVGEIEVDVATGRSLFEMLDLDPALLPDSLGEEPLSVVIPPAVVQTWTYKEQTGLTFIQAPSPTVDFPDDVDTVALGAAALQLLGMSEKDAQRMSRSLDWTSTLVVPIPTEFVSFREVDVDGTTGLLISQKTDKQGDHSAIMWQKGDIIYFIHSNTGMEKLMDIASSVQ